MIKDRSTDFTLWPTWYFEVHFQQADQMLSPFFVELSSVSNVR